MAFRPIFVNLTFGIWLTPTNYIIHGKFTLETGIAVEEGYSILKLLRRVSRPEIQLWVGIHSELDF